MYFHDTTRVLAPKDFCQGNYRIGPHKNPRSKRCLLHWAIYFNRDEACPLAAHIRVAIQECSALPRPNAYGIVAFNDNNPPAVLARVFNRALFLAGYRTDNPESQPLPVLA
jgi:hypothetical protein